MRTARAAAVADVLTGSRLVMAGALIPVVWSSHLTAASTLLTAAWVTDVLDGRIARAARVQGRMGHWDLSVDTAVGVAVLVGLTGAGEVSVVPSVIAVVGLGAWFLSGNVAAAMLLQLAGYLPLLAALWARRPYGWWLPFATALIIAVVDWRRLFLVNIPAFIRGLVGPGIEAIRQRTNN